MGGDNSLGSESPGNGSKSSGGDLGGNSSGHQAGGNLGYKKRSWSDLPPPHPVESDSKTARSSTG
eukprot:5107103-Alexandrium_andersonii.AAC.1